MARRDEYWRRTRRLTFSLLLLWVGITFGCNWFAPELNAISFAGFPFGFYMAAQGGMLLYLLLIGYYNWRMRKLDAEFGIDVDKKGTPVCR